MTLSIISAIAENNAIGKNNDLLWHISEDLKHFKNITLKHSIIMGRKTFESFPRKPLPNRENIIITKQADYSYPDCKIAHSIDEALATCKPNDEVFIIGGAEIYSAFLSMADKMYLTHIHKPFEADTFFPEYRKDEWELVAKSENKQDPKSNLEYHFAEYKRKRN